MNAGKQRRGTVDVPKRMARMGGKWNAERSTWTVPTASRRALGRLLRDLGYAPKGGDVSHWTRVGDETRKDEQ